MELLKFADVVDLLGAPRYRADFAPWRNLSIAMRARDPGWPKTVDVIDKAAIRDHPRDVDRLLGRT
jgi:hypothetical protein